MTVDLLLLLQLAIFLVVVALALICFYVLMTGKPHPYLGRLESEKFFIDPRNNNSKVAFPSLFDTGSVDLSVIVPSYNEEDRLPVMLNETYEYLEDRKQSRPTFSYEIIVVDDGSKDKTSEVALLYSQKYGSDKVRVLTFEKNRGKGGAVRLGMLSARGRLCLFADADAATQFSDIDKLEKDIKRINTLENELAVVCGSRAHLEEKSISDRSLFRTFLMYGFHFLVWFLCVRGLKDTQCGFKLMTRQAARVLFTNLHVERWAFDVDMLYIAQSLNIPISEVAVNWQEIEGSKMVPVWSWLQMGRDLILIRLHYLLGAWKIDPKIKVE